MYLPLKDLHHRKFDIVGQFSLTGTVLVVFLRANLVSFVCVTSWS